MNSHSRSFFLMTVFSGAALSGAAFAAGPVDGDIYGKINVSFDNVDLESPSVAEDEWQLNSNASRFGLKGEARITDSLAAIYKIEWEVDVDGEDAELGRRNRYVGLTGGFGTLIAGRHDTPLKLAQNEIDLFNDYFGDIKATFEGENRISNLVMYTSPKFANFSATLAFGPSEGDSAANDLGEPGDDGAADGISALVDYTLDNLYVALAVDKDVDQQDAVRLVGQYQFDNFQLGLMLQQNEDQASTLDERGFFISAMYTLDKIALKAQFGRVEDDEDDDEEQTASVGADYKLGSATKLFTYYTRNEDSDGLTDVETRDKVFGVGIEHKF